MRRPLHKVSCKAALYNKDKTKVLIAEYSRKGLGLLGGHLEVGEYPEDALRRELFEEIGINFQNRQLKKCDFWIHNEGKLILAFIGELNETEIITRQAEELSSIRWVDINDIKSGKVSAGTYDNFIIKNSANS